MDVNSWAALLGASIIVGFVAFRILLILLPQLETRSVLSQRNEVVCEAAKQREAILSDSASQDNEAKELLLEELEADIESQREGLASLDDDLASKQKSLDLDEARIKDIESKLSDNTSEIAKLQTAIDDATGRLEKSKLTLVAGLEQIAHIDSKKQLHTLASNLIEERQLEAQKVLKLLQEDINASARKKAQQALDRVLTRYQPKFVWPKTSNVIEVRDPRIKETILEEACVLVNDLSEHSGVTISPIPADKGQENESVLVRVAGGFGLHREAVRQTLSDLLENGESQWSSFPSVFARHCNKLEKQALILGQEAINILQLPNVHPEISRLVGALNWRTSYRQNQWYHTVEVAVLAGVIAAELGLDSSLAKRVGMLHDIGKALDYRIDGSHAVISGDYADRCGESRLVCDTVMSHHADLIVETPLAYVLRAADTLSGARPGARVNLEEGYQIRISAIYEAVQSFSGISDIAIMNGGREVHVQVSDKKVPESSLGSLSKAIAEKIQTEVAFPGQIKIVVSRPFESVSVA